MSGTRIACSVPPHNLSRAFISLAIHVFADEVMLFRYKEINLNML